MNSSKAPYRGNNVLDFDAEFRKDYERERSRKLRREEQEAKRRAEKNREAWGYLLMILVLTGAWMFAWWALSGGMPWLSD